MAAMAKSAADIPTRPFGRTGVRVSILAIGGWHLVVPKTDRDTVRLVHAAIDRGHHVLRQRLGIQRRPERSSAWARRSSAGATRSS